MKIAKTFRLSENVAHWIDQYSGEDSQSQLIEDLVSNMVLISQLIKDKEESETECNQERAFHIDIILDNEIKKYKERCYNRQKTLDRKQKSE